MAIYIQIVRHDEDDTGVIYDFGPVDRIAGKVFLDKATGDVSLLELDVPEREGFFLPRVTRVLRRCHEAGEYPAKTCYAA